jgi:hypothetical protein
LLGFMLSTAMSTISLLMISAVLSMTSTCPDKHDKANLEANFSSLVGLNFVAKQTLKDYRKWFTKFWRFRNFLWRNKWNICHLVVNLNSNISNIIKHTTKFLPLSSWRSQKNIDQVLKPQQCFE